MNKNTSIKKAGTESRDSQSVYDEEYGKEHSCKICIYIATCEDEVSYLQ